jgi:hypothetical protein
MKKLFLTLIALIAFSGFSFAQIDYVTHWTEFDYHAYSFQQGFVAAISIDGTVLEVTSPNWDNYEVAAFDEAGNCRGNGMYLNDEFVQEFGDPYPSIYGRPIYYTTAGEEVHFQMWDHTNGVLYTDCTVTQYGAPITILTGDAHFEGWDNPDDMIFLEFTSPAPEVFELPILGYHDNPIEVDGGFNLIASPFGGVAPTEVTNMIADPADDYDLFTFNPSYAAEEWRNYKAEAFTMESGKGYLYASKEDVTLQFTGYPYSGDGIIGLSYTSGDLGGWNLVGNPYKVAAAVNHEYYVLNANRNEVLDEPSSAQVQPGQGIFVYADGEGQSITFTPEGTTKSANVALNLSQGQGIIDRAIIRFSEGRQLPKFQLNPDNTKIYIEQGNKDYAVVSSDGQGEMPVSFKAKDNGTYTFTVSSEEVSFGYLHLIDNKTGNDVNLLETPSYTFDATRSDYPNRFRLVFATGDSSESFGFVTNNEIVLNGVNANTTVQLIDALGRIIISDNGLNSISTNGMANGVYMLRLINGANTTTQKIVVK